MNTDVQLKVTEIQRFCMHDGPGIRTTVFLKGCPLRCAWCHNPETKQPQTELLFHEKKCIACGACISVCPHGAHTIEKQRVFHRENCHACFACAKVCPTRALEYCGKDMTIQQIMDILEKDRAFYGSNGGVTLSGGEPFLQNQGTMSLLKACKARGISTVVETCGYTHENVLLDAIPYVDLFLWDIKDTNDMQHQQYTGVSNQRILNNLFLANDKQAKIRLRCILINGVNTNAEHYVNLAKIAKKIHRLDGVEFIPYHAYGGAKATLLGYADEGNIQWIPSDTQLQQAKNLLQEYNIHVYE